MKRIVLTEKQKGWLFENNEHNWPSYFNPVVKNGNVTLYHGLSNDSLDYVLSEEAFVARTCSEGVCGVWFSIADKRDYPSGYKCLVSIEVPVEEIGIGYSKPFNIKNSTHVFSEKDVPINKYNFKVLKIGGVMLDEEIIEHWKNLLENDKGVEFHKAIFDGICGGYPSICQYVWNLIL